MKSPLHYRQQIPFFYEKTKNEFRQDIYEHYDQMVVRQTALHLADELWERYPFQPVLSWMLYHIKLESNQKIVEVGCGVGRLIGEIAKKNNTVACWGIDYSYQMLRRAHEYWKAKKTIELDWSAKGFSKIVIQGLELPHLQFGLAKGEDLPFEEEATDVVCSSFLLDRLTDPLKGLEEQSRILKKGGKLLMITPLNFQHAKHWELFYSIEKLLAHIEQIGFVIEQLDEEIVVNEPLDAHGNFIQWRCVGIFAVKR